MNKLFVDLDGMADYNVNLQLTGPVMKIDAYWQYLQIGNITIEFPEITQLLTDTQPSFSKS